MSSDTADTQALISVVTERDRLFLPRPAPYVSVLWAVCSLILGINGDDGDCCSPTGLY